MSSHRPRLARVGLGLVVCLLLGVGVAGAAPSETSSETTAGALRLVERTRIQTPYGQGDIAPLEGLAPDAFALVHRRGDVTAYGRQGEILWSRPSMSFFDDWGVEHIGRTPQVLLDSMIVPFELDPSDEFADPLDARTLRSERAFSVGDLNGDGIDELAVGHHALIVGDPDSGTEILNVSAASVLDGRDGSMLWHRLYSGYVTQVLTRPNQAGPLRQAPKWPNRTPMTID